MVLKGQGWTTRCKDLVRRGVDDSWMIEVGSLGMRGKRGTGSCGKEGGWANGHATEVSGGSR